MSTSVITLPTRATLDGVPWVDVAGNVRAALLSGKRITTVMGEALALRRGPGRLTLAEYCYYRLWDSMAPLAEKRRYVGRAVRDAMHLACNDYAWYAVTQDKLLFQAAAMGAGLPVPEMLAVVHPTRTLPGVAGLRSSEATASLLRDPSIYPLFVKPISGIYSLGAINAERIDTRDVVHFADGSDQPVELLASELVRNQGGFLVQRRLEPAADIASRFGHRLWSVRMVVLMTPTGPQVVRGICKIPAPGSVADNFWRSGNMLGAVDLASGVIERVVRGTGQEMQTGFDHPETGQPIVGADVPNWQEAMALACKAALSFPGVATQSWDIALTLDGPKVLELNWGGDLNLAQLAYGHGMLDESFTAHLREHGYHPRRSQHRLDRLRDGLRRA